MQAVRRSPETSRAHALVMAHGRNATAYQILNPGIRYWFSVSNDAVAGYVKQGGWLLAAGEPVCSLATLPAAIAGFEEFARSGGRRVCYVCAAEPIHRVLAGSPGHSVVTIGAHPSGRR